MLIFIRFIFFCSLSFALFYAIYKIINLSSQEKQISHVLNETLFNDNERKFYKALSLIVKKEYFIQAKIRILKFVDAELKAQFEGKTPEHPGLLRLSQKRFDFILFGLDGQPCLIIELENSPHNSPKRKERNLLLELVCKTINVPLLYIQTQAVYNIEELKIILGSKISLKSE